ncbi:single-stranded DNA-binding protein [Desertivirga arenae]|uniref:single-stranded DNA-binding protein n=1 Tax=Desertivirga arenae TaxID=2810309 RepID=UPI001A95B399|nr:single-stranded DNA-binding protein [Pedobacter sp. SYSU D00823]
MSNLRNSVRLIGHLGNDPEIRIVGNKKVAKISIATNTNYRNENGEKIEETQWHNLILWHKNASIAEKYLSKGSKISIEGKLSSRSYTDKSGVKRHVTEIVVNDVLLLGKK